jgi:hypothetical protein
MVAPLINGRSARHMAVVAGSQIAASSQSTGSKPASVHMNSGITKSPVTKIVLDF